HLREKPFEANNSSIAREPRLLARPRQLVEAAGLGFRAVMLPKLRPGELLGGESFGATEWRAIRKRRQHGATRKIDTDSDHRFRIAPAASERAPDRFGSALHPVHGMLQSKILRQFFSGAGQGAGNLSVPIWEHGPTALAAFEIDQNRANRFSAEI